MPVISEMATKWYQTATADSQPLGWHVDMPQLARRKAALEARGGDALAAARALIALANVTQDSETERKARSDANYLLRLHRQQRRGRT